MNFELLLSSPLLLLNLQLSLKIEMEKLEWSKIIT